MNMFFMHQITELMDKFESQFEDLDVQTGVMENAMSGAVTTSVPEDQVCINI